MKNLMFVLVLVANVTMGVFSAVGQTVEARLAALEKRVAELERRHVCSEAVSQKDETEADAAQSRRAKIQARYAKDVEKYGKDALREIERLYRAYAKSRQVEDQSLDDLLSRFPAANRTGCAVMYAGQRAKGDAAVKWYKKAIADHGDCLYGDGAIVGAYARFYLAAEYERSGKLKEAESLRQEILNLYPNAVTHRGQPMASLLKR